MIRWKGLIAPTAVPTGDGRMFAPGQMTHRPLPLPLMARFSSGGHDGANGIGTIDKIEPGDGGYHAEGNLFDPTMFPDVPKAIYLVQQHVLGPSVDLDRQFAVEPAPHPTEPDKKVMLFKQFNVIGATLVPMPAFYQVTMSVDTPEEKTLLASAGIDVSLIDLFTVNTESWKDWPVAPRQYKFDADDAVQRIAMWAGIGSKDPSIDHYASTFLWRNGNQTGDSLAQDSFRLPLADIINGQPHLIYHAVYSAAALLSGAHGGVPRIPDEDKNTAIATINAIYGYLASVFNDPGLTSPFMEGWRQDEKAQHASIEDCGCDNLINFDDDLPKGAIVLGDYSSSIGADNIAFGQTPPSKAGLPADVQKSVDEESRPYDARGKHVMNDDGICQLCGY